MSNNHIESQVRDAFGSLQRPKDLDARTLARINAARASESDNSRKGNIVTFDNGKGKAKRKQAKSFACKAIAACLALCLALFGGWGAFNTPVAFADVEADASVQLAVNGMGRVVAIDALDDQGRAALDELAANGIKLYGLTYEEALQKLVGTSAYQSSSDVPISITVACDNSGTAQSMEQTNDRCLQGRNHENACGTMGEHNEAKQAGMGMHRYAQSKKLVESGECQSVDECKDMSNGEICQRLQKHNQDGSCASSEGSGNGGEACDGNGDHGNSPTDSENCTEQSNSCSGSTQTSAHEGNGAGSSGHGHNGNNHE